MNVVKFKNKKKFYIILIVIFLLLLLLMILIFYIKNNTMIINTKEDKKILNEYSNLLDNIKENMEEISNINSTLNYDVNWSSYKLKLDDESQTVYDSVIRNIRNCYLSYLSQGENKFSNVIVQLENYDKINKKKFNEIMQYYHNIDSSCFYEFYTEFYSDNNLFESDFLGSYDIKELSLHIKPLVLYYKKNNLYIPKNYKELLNEELYKVSLLNNISEFLKLKYEIINSN